MEFKKIQNKYLVRLEQGEEVVEKLFELCKRNEIKNAFFLGIGSIENPILAHYRVDQKKYSEKKLDGIYEVAGFMGNVGMYNKQQLIHAHISVSDDQMNMYGGHLVKGVVSATFELTIEDLGTGYEKQFSDEIGLKLWDLKNRHQ